MPKRVFMDSAFGELAPDYAEVKVLQNVPDFDLELDFTRTYQQAIDEPVAMREAICLRTLFPGIFQPIQPGDLFAGRTRYRQIGFGLEGNSGGTGYYCQAENLRAEMASSTVDDATREQIEAAIRLWESEATIAGKLMPLVSDEMRKYTLSPIASHGGRLAGVMPDFASLMRLGLPGLWAKIERARASRGDLPLYKGMLMALDLLAELALDYAAQARELASQAVDELQEAELLQMAEALEAIPHAAPSSLREGIQLFWLYALATGAVNYGRADVALGDLLARDLDSGVISEKEALRLIMGLWQLIADRHIFFNGRVIIGGKGRPNETNADRFALLAMEASRLVLETEPQLSLRFYQGQDPRLWAKALDVLGEGRTYPMLYNDDVNIPAAAQAFGVDLTEAAGYLPYGCGEYGLDHRGFGSPNSGFNLLLALEATINNGRDLTTGEPLGLAQGDLCSFATFDDLYSAFKRQTDIYLGYLAQKHALEYQAESSSAAFLFASMLYDDCIEKGHSIVDRGPIFTGGIVETFGMVNAADGLAAIKKLVYEEKRLAPERLLAALKADFEDYAAEYRLMKDAPKYGNDDDYVDSILADVSQHIATTCQASARPAGLDYFLVVNINNYVNVSMGLVTSASADGRRAGAPFANGNTPTAGNDVKGVTAFLNSIVKPDPSCHAGYVHNMKFSKPMFTRERPKLEALLKTYFARGGTQAMLTVVSRDDLENAMREPEKYRNLIVRVGGFSARFVELDRAVQLDIIQRTLIE